MSAKGLEQQQQHLPDHVSETKVIVLYCSQISFLLFVPLSLSLSLSLHLALMDRSILAQRASATHKKTLDGSIVVFSSARSQNTLATSYCSHE
jgi:hypothetical protein